MDDARAKEVAKRFGLGATGAYPQGSLGPHDEGELKVAVGVEGGKVVINFGKSLSWVALAPEQALEFAALVAEKAEAIAAEPDPITLGPCCVCGREGPTVRNLIALDKKSPIAGHGWGCFVCDLPPDGAQAVACDACACAPGFEASHLKFACRGYPGREGRVPVGELTGTHAHDRTKHPGEESR